MLRAEIREAVAEGRLPETLLDLWRQELALVVDALRVLARQLEPVTAKRRVSRSYRDYIQLVDRATTLARWLGLSASDITKAKAWSKMSREEQEREAQRALDEVEANLRGANREDDE